MKLSIVSAVLNSHEVVWRQLNHYNKMDLPDDIEVIFVDDGSIPSLNDYLNNDNFIDDILFNFRIYETNDYRPWTEHIARNRGAGVARGEYLLMLDIDYILPKETIEIALAFNGDKMTFRRRFGILNEDGDIVDDDDTLREWNLKPRWIRKKYVPGHRSQYLMRKDLFNKIGGYREYLFGKAHPEGGGAGQKFFHKWERLEAKGEVFTVEERPDIYMFPVGKFCEGSNMNTNPKGLFHNLSR